MNTRSKASKYQEKNGKSSSAEFRLSLDEKQKPIVGSFYENQINILTGDPGTGKTFMAVFYAIKMLASKEIDKIIISKSPVETGKGIGFLPGTAEEKLLPFKESFLDVMDKIVGKQQVDYWVDKKVIVFEPMGFVRGKSFEDAVIILDEVQNCTLKEIMSFTSRICEDSKMILLGDFYQTDIKDSGLNNFIKICEGIKNISNIALDKSYQKRARIITEMFENYKNFIDKQK